MLFTLSAPALAANDIEYNVWVGGATSTLTRATSANYGDILGDGQFSYDPVTNTLRSNKSITKAIRINAPGADVVLDGGNAITVRGNLIIEDAHDVTISSD